MTPTLPFSRSRRCQKLALTLIFVSSCIGSALGYRSESIRDLMKLPPAPDYDTFVIKMDTLSDQYFARGGEDQLPLMNVTEIKLIGATDWDSQGPAQAQDNVVKIGLRKGSLSLTEAMGDIQTVAISGLLLQWIDDAGFNGTLVRETAALADSNYGKVPSYMKPNSTLGLNHLKSLGRDLPYLKSLGLDLPKNVSVIPVCPDKVGTSLRRRAYTQGEEVNGVRIISSVSIHQDVDGRSIDIPLGSSLTIATSKKEQEYTSNIFGKLVSMLQTWVLLLYCIITPQDLEKRRLPRRNQPLLIFGEVTFGTRPAGIAGGTSAHCAFNSSSPTGIRTSAPVSALRLCQRTRVIPDPREDSIQPEKEWLQLPTMGQRKQTRIPLGVVLEGVYAEPIVGAAGGTSTQGAANNSNSWIGLLVSGFMGIVRGTTRVESDPMEDSVQPVLAPDEVTCSEFRRGNILVVGLMNAKRLRNNHRRNDHSKKYYPYVKISLGSKHFITPKAYSGGCSNPNWGCIVEFTLPEGEFDQNVLTLSFEICTRGSLFWQVQTVGDAHVLLTELPGSSGLRTLPVSTGELNFSYKFTDGPQASLAAAFASASASTATSPEAASTAITVPSQTNSRWRRIRDYSIKAVAFFATVGSGVAAVGTWVASFNPS